MSVIPTGAPAWTRTVDVSHYGGDPNKINHNHRGAIDQSTDVDVAQFMRLTADLAAVARTAPFCVLRIQCNDTDTDIAKYLHVPMVQARAMFGVTHVPYRGNNPLGGFPSVVRDGDGTVIVTFPDSYVDSYGVVAPFAISMFMPGKVVGTDPKACVGSEQLDAHRVRLRALSGAGAAIQDALIDGFQVW